MIVSVLRKEARESLKGKWKKAFLIMLVFYVTTILIGLLVSWISAISPYGTFAVIINIVISVALNYGILASFIKLKRNEKINVFHFIYFGARDLEKVWKNIGRLILKFLFYIILLLLFVYLSFVEFISLFNGYGMRLSFFVEILSAIGLSVFISMKMLCYSLMNYVLYDNREYKAKEILKESERLMKKHRWDFVKLNISFAGWFILGIAFSVSIMLSLYFFAEINSYYLIYINYIPLIFLLPYMYTATICFYDNLLYNNPKPKEEETTKKSKKKNKKSK